MRSLILGAPRSLALAAVALLAGCAQTKTIEVQPPPPPPTVVEVTDTLYVDAAPIYLGHGEGRVDTLYVPAPPDGTAVSPTRPERVTVYAARRLLPERALTLHALALDEDALTLHSGRRDLRYRAPRLGERLVLEALGPDSLTARVEGTPRRPPLVHVDCPAPPEPLIPSGLLGWCQLAVVAAAAACVGAIAVAFVKA